MDRPIPPTLRARYIGMLTRHPFELIIVGHGSSLLGIILLTAWVRDGWNPAPSIALMPNWVHAIIGAPLLAGGILDLCGLLCGARNHRTRWRLERAGLTLVGYALVSYGAVAILQELNAIMPAVIAFSIALACVARITVTFVEEHRADAAKRLDRLEGNT